MVAESATLYQPGQTYNVQPLPVSTWPRPASRPSSEASFLVDGVRHQYSFFAMTADRIVSEQLMVYAPRSRRSGSAAASMTLVSDVYEFSAYPDRPRKLWRESTRPNALCFSPRRPAQ